MSKSFGFDLDNTLIDYSSAVKEFCKMNSLPPCNDIGMLKAMLRKFGNSDYDWQLAQSWLYTSGLEFAQPGVGSIDLISYLSKEGYQLYVVSHKTSHTPKFCGQIPLHDLAINWIRKSGLSDYFQDQQRIYFEPTRESKVRIIRNLSLDYFVDDLEEVFEEPNFPSHTKKFLIHKSESQNSTLKCVIDFNSIREILANGL